jgi:hypothetical protein
LIERLEEATAQAGLSSTLPPLKELRAEILAVVEEYKLKDESTPILELLSRSKGSLNDGTSGLEAFTVGDTVMVRRLGKSPATVVELQQNDSDFLTVQLGTLKMQVKPSEVFKVTVSSAPPRTKVEAPNCSQTFYCWRWFLN